MIKMKSARHQMAKFLFSLGPLACLGVGFRRKDTINSFVGTTDDIVQEYEAGIMPVLPPRGLPSYDDQAAQ